MNYAIIADNQCVNIIVAEADFAKQLGAIELPKGYGIGDNYIDGIWSKTSQPEPKPLTDEEKKAAYENLTVQYIREQYFVDDEAKIIRECLANAENAQENFTIYNAYVESCKAKANKEIYGN